MGVPEHAGTAIQEAVAAHPAATTLASDVNLKVSAPVTSDDVKVGMDNVPDEGPYKTGEAVEGPL